MWEMRAMFRQRWASTLLLCALCCAGNSACDDAEAVYLVVKLRTDYQPVREFSSVKVTVDAQPHDRLANIDGAYVRPGEPLARFDGLSPVDKRAIHVSLARLGGNELASTTVLIEHRQDIELTVSVTRDCSGVRCDALNGLARRCLAGSCVDARCATGNESFCANALVPCQDSTCTTQSMCATASCVEGVCFEDAQTHNCAADEVCDIDVGCVPGSVPGDCTTTPDCLLDNASLGCVSAVCAEESQLCVYDLAPDGMAPAGSDCAAMSGMCMRGVCLLHCNNGVMDGDETAVDCGGSCSACSLGDACLVDSDCDTLVCDAIESNVCENADVCGNGRVEVNEYCDDGNAVGGDGCSVLCRKEQGGACTAYTECESGACQNGLCAAPSCADGIRNGDEIGADCGGSCPRSCVAYDCSTQVEIEEFECQKLKDLYNAANGSSWTNVTDWFSSPTPCSWSGLACNTNTPRNITTIDVRDDAVSGVIARGLDVIRQLEIFELHPNACCSTPSTLGGPIPSEIGSLSALQILSLRNNVLNGPIPSSLGQLSNLTVLHLYFNQLTGGVPKELGQLSGLTQLHLYANQLSGTLPPELGQLANVTQLLLYTNNLDGSIPAAFGQLASVEQLYLHANQLTGALPAELGQLSTTLRRLYLNNNQLSGTLPIELGQLLNLERLYLHDNSFGGTPPMQIGLLDMLDRLFIQNNQLSGMLPTEITGMTALTMLDICPQTGSLTSDAATGSWLRSVTTSDWPGGNSC